MLLLASNMANPLRGHSTASDTRRSVDTLARNVLVASGLISQENTDSTTLHMERLEKYAGCHVFPLPSLHAAEIGGESDNTVDTSNALLTCTNPIPFKNRPAGDVWNPLDPTARMPSTDLFSHVGTTGSLIHEDKEGGICMEDAAPFSPNFYRAFGELLCECSNSHQSSLASIDYDRMRANKTQGSIGDLRRDSLPRDNISVRVTRLLRVMMDMNVGTIIPNVCSDRDGSGDGNQRNENVSFLSLLLMFCEGNEFQGNTSIMTVANVDGAEQNMQTLQKPTRVPIIKALFKVLGALPNLEAHVRILSRQNRFVQSRQTAEFVDATVGMATPPSTTTDSSIARLREVKLWEHEKERLNSELVRHISTLEYIVRSVYKECNPILRGRCRTHLGGILHNFALSASMRPAIGSVRAGPLGVEDTSAAGIEASLKILLSIVEGIDRQLPLKKSHISLLFDILIPLHRPNGMVLWRDQTPVIGLYHESLVQCIGALLLRNRMTISRLILALLHPSMWPTAAGKSSQGEGSNRRASFAVNTPKSILLLHEVDTYLGLLGIAGEESEERQNLLASFSETILPLIIRLSACIECENSRTSERALQIFRNSHFTTLIKHYKRKCMPMLIKALCRRNGEMEVPWNPTVRKMTLLVLTELENYDKDFFCSCCESAFGQIKDNVESIPPKDNDMNTPGQETALVRGKMSAATVTQEMTTLRGAMGDWRPTKTLELVVDRDSRMRSPPPRLLNRNASSSGKSDHQPPLSLTGVSPWAAKRPSPSFVGVYRGTKQPPLTVTGVAPWAVQRSSTQSAGGRLGSGLHKKTRMAKIEGASMSLSANDVEIKDAKRDEDQSESCRDTSGLRRVRHYMDKLRPPKIDGESDAGGASNWAKAQMAESPTLLPNLKFHDLVFGQALGEGSFGSVKYARRIMKDRTRSLWPEYAVKVVSTQKIMDLGYEQSINREIAILAIQSHPGIARLISTFRFRDGAYLVLEYASGGDLHTLLKKNGSLDHPSTRFVAGETIAAILSIHEAGFVYCDLKPENILITESGHIKLTDFGGARPFSKEAKELVYISSKNILKNLRNGDWRDLSTANSFFEKGSVSVEGQGHSDNELKVAAGIEEEEFRIEGTTAYLPPEVVVGGIPTTAADSWALGCVLYQCIAGRPPLLEDTDHLTRHRIVTFELSTSNEEDDFFGRQVGSSFRPEARDLIRRLLSRNSDNRPTMADVARDTYFDGEDILSLHKRPPHPLDIGGVAPSADAKWNRRQFSSIWAPQPKAYSIDSLRDHSGPLQKPDQHFLIPEGDESEASFLPTRRTNLTKIGEQSKSS